MTNSTTEPLSSLADSIIRRGLAAPAVFMLELHKPISTLLSFGFQTVDPLLRAIFGGRSIDSIEEVLSSRDSIEQLIILIEERS